MQPTLPTAIYPQCAFWGRLELRSFFPEDCVHNIAVRIVEGLPYGFILGARFFYANKSILNFGTDKGFKPTPASPWVPFLDKKHDRIKLPRVLGPFLRLLILVP